MRKLAGMWFLMIAGSSVAYGVLVDGQIIIAMFVGAIFGIIGAWLIGIFNQD